MAGKELTILLTFMTALAKAQEGSGDTQCLKASNGSNSLPLFRSPIFPTHLRANPIQVLITSYQFQCCGRVTAWGAYVGPENQDRTISIQFQVWRALDNIGCYTNVGTNRFDGIDLSDNLILANVSTTDQIQVMPGDVVGYIQQREVNFFEVESGIQFANQHPYRNESVWYTILSGGTKQTQCLQSATNINNFTGILSRFSNIGPVITAHIATSECTPTGTTQPPPNTEFTTLIGASAGVILGGLLLLLLIIIVTVTLIYVYTKVKKRSNVKPPEVLYDVIAEGPIVEHNTQQVTIETAANQAYTGITLVPLTRANPHSTQYDMKDNTAYMGTTMAASTREEGTQEDECGEYVRKASQYDVLRLPN